ncbi:MAG: glycosyltransferase family 61 protein [Aquisalinus sp.]|nr:glycosyltransferase family 61 protein [Aquisalinus sp.]
MADRKSKLQRKLNGRYVAWQLSYALVSAAPFLRNSLNFFGRALPASQIESAQIITSDVVHKQPFSDQHQSFIKESCGDDKERFLTEPQPDYYSGDVTVSVRYALLSQATFYAHAGSVADKARGVIVSEAPGRPNWNHDKIRITTQKIISDEALAIPVRRYTNYSHFLFDHVLPVLTFLQENTEISRDAAFYLVEGQPDFVNIVIEKMAEHFGLKIQIIPRNAQLQAERMLQFEVEAPCSTWTCGTPAVAQLLRNILLDEALPPDRKPWRKVYLHRDGAKWRNLDNADEVRQLMQSAGFEVFTPQQDNFLEQVRLISETRLLASAHGAALTNLLFMPEGGRVIEFFPEDFAISCYLAAARFMGHDHSSVIGINTGGRQNYAVPADRLKAEFASLAEQCE